jgi:hypothetical protein
VKICSLAERLLLVFEDIQSQEVFDCRYPGVGVHYYGAVQWI